MLMTFSVRAPAIVPLLLFALAVFALVISVILPTYVFYLTVHLHVPLVPNIVASPLHHLAFNTGLSILFTRATLLRALTCFLVQHAARPLLSTWASSPLSAFSFARVQLVVHPALA
jgi:hypothetical protein